MSIAKEFREFAVRGNVVDMAVGIIIGGAFGKIVSSLVADVLMPPIGMLLGGVNFGALAVTLREASGEVPAVTLAYGKFLTATVDFVLIAWAVFLLVKGVNALKRKQEQAPAAPPAPAEDVKLLTEIRDLLRAR